MVWMEEYRREKVRQQRNQGRVMLAYTTETTRSTCAFAKLGLHVGAQLDLRVQSHSIKQVSLF